ncbi:MAG TPA: MATE family efflux transporter [Lachnospiraceae bacterium]|nr:MATE family efflux transporter [Lachnospiraceae bacterium]
MKIKRARAGFYRNLFTLVLPIVIQNLIASAVSMADVVMLGRVDQTSLAASSLAGQVQFLLYVVYFGVASAVTILATQYWGKGDSVTVSNIFALGLIISAAFSTLAAVLALAVPDFVIGIWTNVPELKAAGAAYLRYVALSYFFAGIIEPYLAIIKSCERVKLATLLSVATLLMNIILNAVLIFGLFSLPAMGIRGAALATTLSRGAELMACAVDFTRQRIMPVSLKVIFDIPAKLIRDFARYSLPAFINDAMWGLAFNMNSVIMGHLGSDIVAANSVVTVARDLVTTVGIGIAAGSSILLGKEIGEGRLERAKEDADSVLWLSFKISLLQGAVLFIISPFIPGFVRISQTAAWYLRVMLYISVIYQVGQIINTVLIASLFRCGGDSRYGMILDIISMWGVSVPLGLISAFVLKLPPLWVYVLMCTDEFVKMPFAIRHFKKGGWIKNITRDM